MNDQVNERAPKAGLVRLPLCFADLQQFDSIIDVRSPAEYALDHLPGAISCPVLDDAERTEVGTLYKQESRFAAKRVGAALVAQNIGKHIAHFFHDKPANWRPLVYCWRGGARSGAMTHILRQVGWDAAQLEGGYKQWRAMVVRDLAHIALPFRFIAVCGKTGAGKSRLLQAIAAIGAQVLDLEELAAHKGSVLGDLPDCPQPSQKMFDTRIWQALSALDPALPVFVEAESRKVGALRVPDGLMQQMWQAPCLMLATATDLRVPLLCEEYAHLIANPVLLAAKLECLRPLHASEKIEQWLQLVEAQDWMRLVRDLLVSHYDPAYGKSMFNNYRHLAHAATIQLRSIDRKGFADAAFAALTVAKKVSAPVASELVYAKLESQCRLKFDQFHS